MQVNDNSQFPTMEESSENQCSIFLKKTSQSTVNKVNERCREQCFLRFRGEISFLLKSDFRYIHGAFIDKSVT